MFNKEQLENKKGIMAAIIAGYYPEPKLETKRRA
jgi:hypothetical protein